MQQQQFDTSPIHVEETEEALFSEPTRLLKAPHKHLLLRFLISAIIIICIYVTIDHFYFHNIIFLLILFSFSILGIHLLLFLIWLLLEQWLMTHIYFRKARALSEQENALYVPIRVDLSPPDSNFSASNDLLELLQRSGGPVLILGSAGAGKTMAMHAYQQRLLTQRQLRHRGRSIPVFISLKDFNAFLKSPDGMPLNSQSEADGTPRHITFPHLLRTYLYNSKGPESMRSLAIYLPELLQNGRVLLLCDGLNEVDSDYREALCKGLSMLMVHNRVIMTCRELDYHNSIFETVVNERGIQTAIIKPLETDQQDTFIHTCIENEQAEKPWICTSQQMIDFITSKNLRSECTNPQKLLALMRIIDAVIETTKEINTLGKLLREFVSQLVEPEKTRERWQACAFSNDELLRYVGEIACTMRRMKCIDNGLNLNTSASAESTYAGLAEILADIIKDPPVRNAGAIDLSSIPPSTSFEPLQREQMLEFAEHADLLSIDRQKGVLNFRHKLMAEYFVAEYLHAVDEISHQSYLPYGKELISKEEYWNEPIRIWAGLLDDPMSLAARLGDLGYNYRYEESDRSYNALTLGVMCLGVHWVHAYQPVPQQLWPDSLDRLLRNSLSDKTKREHLAVIFERCAQEGSDVVYQPLLKVLTLAGADELLLMLPGPAMEKLLYEYLTTIADLGTYTIETRILVSVLGRVNSESVLHRAIELSKPPSFQQAQEKQSGRRRAAIEILSYYKAAIGTLINYLDDEEVSDKAVEALQHMKIEEVLEPLLSELVSPINSSNERKQLAILKTISKFLEEASQTRHQDIIKQLLHSLSSPYQSIQEEAKALLIKDARSSHVFADDVKKELISALSMSNSVAVQNIQMILEEIGDEATKFLLDELENAGETVRIHIIRVFRATRDFAALLTLRELIVADPSNKVREEVALTLSIYPADKVIQDLIERILGDSDDEANAARIGLEAYGRNAPKNQRARAVDLILQRLLDRDASRSRIALLVCALRAFGDKRIVRPLCTMLQQQPEACLTGEIIKTLALFQEPVIVTTLLSILNTRAEDKKVVSEAIDALSRQGEDALPTLLHELENKQGNGSGIREAIIRMKPFPEQALLKAFGQYNDAQAFHITTIFQHKIKEEAPFLVENLCNTNPRIQHYVRLLVAKQDANTIVEPLLNMMLRTTDAGCRHIVMQYLSMYPEEAIPHLITQLSNGQASRNAVEALIAFDAATMERLYLLIPALNEPSGKISQLAQEVLVEVAQQQPRLLTKVIALFQNLVGKSNQHAYTILVDILSTHLASISGPFLLKALASEHWSVQQGAVDTLICMGRQKDTQSAVIRGLIEALVTKSRSQAEKALIGIGEQAIPYVHPHVIDDNMILKQSTRSILSQMGPRAFAVLISDLHSQDPSWREAAEAIIMNMDPLTIKDTLIQWLAHNNARHVEQGRMLLLGRIQADARASSGQPKMITVLLEHIQQQDNIDRTTLPVLTFLLSLPDKQEVLDTLVQVLHTYPQAQQWLTPLFLFLRMDGSKAKDTLLQLLYGKNPPFALYKELLGILGLLEDHRLVVGSALSLGENAQSALDNFDQRQLADVELARRALGSLLVSDNWDTKRLRTLLKDAPEGSVRHELLTVLLGGSYLPYIASLQKKLSEEKEKHEKALEKKQKKITDLTDENKKKDETIASLMKQIPSMNRPGGQGPYSSS
jgi:HEAT repeats